MYRNTVLKQVACDLKKLPLEAKEAFVLSTLDGKMDLEHVAISTGLEFAEMATVARRLEELGAVEHVEARTSLRASLEAAKKAVAHGLRAPDRASRRPRPPGRDVDARKPTSARVAPSAKPPIAREDDAGRTSSRAPPRSRSTGAPPAMPAASDAPKAARAASDAPTAARAASEAPKTARATAPKTPANKTARRTASAARAARRSTPARPAVDETTCDLDGDTRARIAAMDARIAALDHYALFEIERSADKKTIKRAYFALAAKFHPDCFFGKKLGPMRSPIERIFGHITAAHDTLVARERRAAYDARLPSAPRLRAPAAPSDAPQPPAAASSPPVAEKPPTVPPPTLVAALPPGGEPLPVPPASPPRSPAPAPDRAPPSSDEALRRLYACAKQLEVQKEVQKKVDLFLAAAEEALKKDDVLGAANGYRLALQNTEDPAVRQKLDAIEPRARARQHEVSLARGRAAEKAERWAEAASAYTKAYAAQPEAHIADKAAQALRKSGGDLHRAAQLAEAALAAEPKNAGYRVTLGEVYLAANLFTRAAASAAQALELAPTDARARALEAALPGKKA